MLKELEGFSVFDDRGELIGELEVVDKGVWVDFELDLFLVFVVDGETLGSFSEGFSEHCFESFLPSFSSFEELLSVEEFFGELIGSDCLTSQKFVISGSD